MSVQKNPLDAGSAEVRIDDRDAALEESDEERGENAVVEEADANSKGTPSMPEFDLYINPLNPAIGLYVRAGAGLPDILDSKQWIFDITVSENETSDDVVQRVKADGHAFQELD